MKSLKSVKLLLVTALAVGFVKANAQTDELSKSNSSAATEAKAANTVKIPPVSTQRKLNSTANAEKITNDNHSVINENDPYMGRSKEFLTRLTVAAIPADFPKYQPGYGVKYYNDLVEGYYISHPAIVQKWVTDKLNSKKEIENKNK